MPERTPSLAELYLPFWLLDQQRKGLKTYSELLRPLDAPEWTTPNKVELIRDNVILRNFTNENSRSEFPLLIVPPQAGHHSRIVDYGPDQSLTEAALNAGASVYVCEWLEATRKGGNVTLDDLIEDTDACVEAIPNKDEGVTIVGPCQGGTQSTIYAALHPDKVSNLIIAGAPINFRVGNSKIQRFVDMTQMDSFKKFVKYNGGIVPGQAMLTGFKMLNAYDRFVKDPWNLYENIDNGPYLERSRRFRNWYEWTQSIAGNFYLKCVKELFKENRLVKGELEINGRNVDLSRISCPVTLVEGDEDDITVPAQLFDAENHVGSRNVVKFLVPKVGHIGSFMSREVIREYWQPIFQRAARISSGQMAA